MKLMVEQMPNSPKNCLFSKWKPNPPFIEEPGTYTCKNDERKCDLRENECRFMKAFIYQIGDDKVHDD